MNLVDKAGQFIALKHDGQYRRGFDFPYSTHLFGVARVLKNAKYPEQVVVAGLLHDILEDSDTTEQELLENFGLYILELVKAVSDPDKSIPWKERKQYVIARIPQLTDEQMAITLAEKIQNLNSMTYVISTMGEEAWYGKSANKEEQRWFYEQYFEATKKYHSQTKLLGEFEECLEKLFSLI